MMMKAGFNPGEARRTWIKMNKWKSVYRRPVRFVLNLTKYSSDREKVENSSSGPSGSSGKGRDDCICAVLLDLWAALGCPHPLNTPISRDGVR
jgi:hypothetical protein